LHPHLRIAINQYQKLVSAVAVVNLFDSWSWFQFNVFGFIFFGVQAKEKQPFCVYLLVQAIHCLLDFQIFFEKDPKLALFYSEFVGYLREADAYLCLAK